MLLIKHELGKIPILNGDLVLISGKEAMKQNIREFLHIAMGEYFLNEGYGIDYFNHGYTTDNKKDLFDADVTSWISQRDYVTSINSYNSEFADGILSVTIEIGTREDGIITVEETL